jgi:predicted phosphodiesterase
MTNISRKKSKTSSFCFAVISDIHGNLEALEAVLEAISREHVDAVYCLGDLVGYGPNPNECIDLAQDHSNIVIAGNHDWAAIGYTDTDYFNIYAKIAIMWTSQNLTEENHEFLEKVPLLKRLNEESIFLVHATPKSPDEWHYILNYHEAEENFEYLPDKFCLIGHSHVPVIMEKNSGGKINAYRGRLFFRDDCSYIINVGSVGQPRDGNPLASFGLLYPDKIEIKRVPYDISKTQEKMRKAELPEYLIERLAVGR